MIHAKGASLTLAMGLIMGWAVSTSSAQDGAMGNAWQDERNPIRQIFEGERLDLWSLQPIASPPLPEADPLGWSSNPIDRLLIQSWNEAGLAPAPGLDLASLAQRASLDLTGLRASREDVDALVRDPSPDAYERWIDRLLASPAYGEHWARLWLDVVRYSDSNGFDWDEFRKAAWRYRDFVVRAWNRDMPFDQFVVWQLAGDEILDGLANNPDEQDCLIATGYLRLGPYDSAASLFNEQDRARTEVLTDLTETTASAFLGLTLSCCRCHDHKTDPLSQADHYRFRAFFAATRLADDLSIDTKDVQESKLAHNQAIDRQIEERKANLDTILNRVKNIKQVDEPKLDVAGDDVTKGPCEVEDDWMARLAPEDRATIETLRGEIEALSGERKPMSSGMLMTDDPNAIDTIHVLYQGDHRSPKEKVDSGFPSVLFPNAPVIESPANGKTTGRRLALARWIGSPENPWAARVLVNRLWQQHFGVGLVSTPNDFGISGSEPIHPQLLDFLASELIRNQWSIKAIQRMIVTSSAYQQRALPSGASRGSEPGLVSAHSRLKRLSAEQLRDAILQVSGLLQHRAGGPPIWPSLSEEILQANPAVLDDNETKTKGWYPSPNSEQSVRSIYLIQKRTLRLPWMEIFDLPENTVSCAKREMSIVPPQALSLLNGELTERAAVELAQRLTQTDPATYVHRVFERVLARDPTAMEQDRCVRFLEGRSREELALVLLNSNELAFVP
jgi:hypothetical protein